MLCVFVWHTQLGWGYNQFYDSEPIDEYENKRRRNYGQQTYHLHRLSPLQRYIKLHAFGYDDQEIAIAFLCAAKRRDERDKSLARMKYDRYDELKEDVRLSYKTISNWGILKKGLQWDWGLKISQPVT